MIITYKWLQDYISIPLPADELAVRMTDMGMEVKSINPNPADAQDWIIEVEITPNRPDCLSMYGIARELSAGTGWALTAPKMDFPEDKTPASELAAVEIKAPDLCMRYCARVIRGVKIGPSPDWMVKRLEAVGVRSINNVVDVTNYVLMELGHPLHAFDLHWVAGPKIIVRRANKDEILKTLDGQDRKLDPERLVIADPEKPVALAGVMGGANSEVLDTTVDLLIESAYFDPVSIRRTSKKLGLRSEASYRFERGTDPETALKALNRTAALITELAGGKAAKGIIDQFPTPDQPVFVPCRLSRINQLLGINLTKKTVHAIFERMGCIIESKSANEDIVEIPSHRKDLVREIDLVEEVARLYGMDKCPSTDPKIVMRPVLPYPISRIDKTAHEILVSLGFWEVVNYTFVNSAEWEQLGFKREEMIPLRNPMSSEMDVLRMSLLPAIIRNIARNMDQGEAIVRVFEIGRVMKKSPDGSFKENTVLSIAASGKSVGAQWQEKGFAIDFYGFKGLCEYLFRRFEKPIPNFKPFESVIYNPGMAAELIQGKKSLGSIGKVSPAIASKLGFDKEVYYLEIILDEVIQLPETRIAYRALPKYPAVQRDISLLVPGAITADQIDHAIVSNKNPLVESVSLFDLYSGDRIPKGFRSLSFRITYRHSERTLQETEVEEVHAQIVQNLVNQYQVQLRTN